MKATHPLVVLGIIGIGILCLVSFEAGKQHSRASAAPVSAPPPVVAPVKAQEISETRAIEAAAVGPGSPVPAPLPPSPSPLPDTAPVQNNRTADIEREKACKTISELSVTIMRNRLDGVAMSAMLEVAGQDPLIADVTRALVMAAYEKPRYSTESMQLKAIEDFQNDSFLECIKSLGQPA